MDEEVKKMGKKASLRYKASRDGFNPKILQTKCLGQNETIVLAQTDLNSVIGGYMPEQWEYTNGKAIKSGKPFLFYWVNDQIQIIKHRNDTIPVMASDKDLLMCFGYGLAITTDPNVDSLANAADRYWVHP